MRPAVCGAVAWITLIGASNAHAGESAHQHLRIEVVPVHELGLDGGDVHLTVDGFSRVRATGDPAALRWATPEASHKVVVASDSLDARFRLLVDADAVRGGVGAGEVTLSPVAQDLVHGVSSGGATLRYSALAMPGDGVGADVHRVTYTLMDE